MDVRDEDEWWKSFHVPEMASLFLQRSNAAELEETIAFLLGELVLRPGDRVYDQCCGTRRPQSGAGLSRHDRCRGRLMRRLHPPGQGGCGRKRGGLRNPPRRCFRVRSCKVLPGGLQLVQQLRLLPLRRQEPDDARPGHKAAAWRPVRLTCRTCRAYFAASRSTWCGRAGSTAARCSGSARARLTFTTVSWSRCGHGTWKAVSYAVPQRPAALPSAPDR